MLRCVRRSGTRRINPKRARAAAKARATPRRAKRRRSRRRLTAAGLDRAKAVAFIGPSLRRRGFARREGP